MRLRPADGLVLAILFLCGAWLGASWSQLPERLPVHWNYRGEIDGHAPKWLAVAVPFLVSVGVWALLRIAPLISPRGFGLDGARRLLDVCVVGVVLLSQGSLLAMTLVARGMAVPVDDLAVSGAGLLVAAVGYCLRAAPPNFFVGIRTPWTLAERDVWTATHRLAAPLWVACGSVMALAAWLPGAWRLGALGVVLLGLVYPVLHSFLLYRSRIGFDDRRR